VTKDHPFVLAVKKKKEEMTGWERVRYSFSPDEFGEPSPELMRIKDATLIGVVVGVFMGAMGRGRVEYMDFFRRNTVTQFESPLKAKSALQDQMFLGMGGGAFRLGWRMGIFTFMYMSGATIISSYRNKYGVIDQVAGAGTAGFLYKFRDGPKAAFAGGFFGSLLGLAAGTMTLGVMKLVGSDFEFANLEYYHKLEKRIEKEKASLRNEREKDTGSSIFSDQTFQEINTTKLETAHNLYITEMKLKMAEEAAAAAAAAREKSKESSTSSNNLLTEQNTNNLNQSADTNNAIEEK